MQNVGVIVAVAEEVLVHKYVEIGHFGPAAELVKNEKVLGSNWGP